MAQRSTSLRRGTLSSGRLRSLLGVEPSEGALVGGLAGLYATLMLGVVFVQTIAFALFIREFGAASLPYAYISIALLAALVAFGFLRLADRISFRQSLLANVAFLVVGCALFWVGLSSPLGQWAIFLLPAWFQTQINMVNLVVWPLAGRLLDVRQARRLLGLVGAGNWVANIVGGFIVAPLVVWLGAGQMTLLAAALTAAGLWLLWAILQARMPAGDPVRAGARATPSASPARRPAPDEAPLRRYIWLILAYVFLWWMAFFFLDNIFYSQAAAQFADAAELAGAIGLLLSATGVVALFTSLALTGFVLRRYGLRATLLAMPALCGAIVAALAIAGSLGLAGAPLFWLAALAKMINVAWGFSLSQSALVLSYQPLPGDRRGQTQTLAEGIVQPLAIGIAGLSLLGLNRLLGLESVALAWFFVGIVALLIAVIVLIGRRYPQALSGALARRQWGGTAAEPLDQAGLDLLRQALRSPHPAAVIYGLELIERSDPAALAAALPELLDHPAPEVRRVALERIEALRLHTAAGRVRDSLAAERAPEVQSAALIALAALAAPQDHAPIAGRLNDPAPHIRRGALVGLLRYAEGERALLAEGTLRRLALSADPADRALAARALADLGAARLAEILRPLLADQRIDVRREALGAAARMRAPELWPAVVEAGATPGTRRAAGQALAAGGAAALPAIAAALARPELPDSQAIALAGACARIGGGATQPLLARLDQAEGQARTAILEALSAAGYRVADPQIIRAQTLALASRAAWAAASLVDIGEAEALRPLRGALEMSLRGLCDQLCLWLSFRYDAPAILRARAALAGEPGPRHAYALEILDTQLPADLKGPALAVAEQLSPHERLARLSAVFPQASQTRDERLLALIAGPEAGWLPAWARACALFAAGSLPTPACLAAARLATSDARPLVQEAARAAVTRLAPAEHESEHPMLSTIEKVLILKTVDVFRRTPDDVLADVAALLEEVEVAAGETIFQKGDPGDSLSIIVAGKVRVHDGERLLNYLGERDVFGEMALLDTETRAASVTAVEPTRLLRLNQEPFYELLAERPEIAIGLIRVLSGHLRDRIRDVAELSTRVQQLGGAG